MGNALRMGLAGGLMGAMGGLHDRWQETQQEIKTERLRAARQLENEALAKIAAENEAAKDAREHGQAIELEGIKSGGREKLEASKQSAADKRLQANIEAADRRAAATAAAGIERAKISASRPTAAGKPSWKSVKQGDGWIYVDQVTNAPVLDEQGQPRQAPPPYRERAGSSAKAPPPAPAAPSAPAAEVPSANSGMFGQSVMSEPAQPKNQAEYDMLPRGARFKDPSGNIRIKP